MTHTPLRRRRCLAPGCREWIPAPKFVCLEHWRRLPEQLRAQVIRWWRGAPGGVRHRRAVVACIQWLRDQERRGGTP